MSQPSQKPLLLILARNLITGLDLPSFITDPDGDLVFFNEAAGDLLGYRFEELGPIPREKWAEKLGPFDGDGCPVAADDQPFARALKSGRPFQGEFVFRVGRNQLTKVEVSAIPMAALGRFSGCLIMFWPIATRASEDHSGAVDQQDHGRAAQGSTLREGQRWPARAA